MNKINKNFPSDFQSALTRGNSKVFCRPVDFKYGKNYENKSIEARSTKITREILKLQYLLMNDQSNSHSYLL
jgi:hypothetical protein